MLLKNKKRFHYIRLKSDFKKQSAFSTFLLSVISSASPLLYAHLQIFVHRWRQLPYIY